MFNSPWLSFCNIHDSTQLVINWQSATIFFYSSHCRRSMNNIETYEEAWWSNNIDRVFLPLSLTASCCGDYLLTLPSVITSICSTIDVLCLYWFECITERTRETRCIRLNRYWYPLEHTGMGSLISRTTPMKEIKRNSSLIGLRNNGRKEMRSK